MFEFLKKLFSHEEKIFTKEEVVILIQFPKEDTEYITKELCRARIQSIHGVSTCGHCTPESEYDLLALAKWNKDAIEQNIQLIKSQLPEKVKLQWDVLVPV